MPGVVISTSVRTGPSSATIRESSQLFVVGQAERGPSDAAVLVESLAEFEAIFGEYMSTSYLHPTIETFFEEGGTRAYIGRVVGPAAVIGEITLTSASGGGGSDVIALTANGAGDWSDNLDVEVTQPTPGTNFKINFYYNDVLVYSTGTVTTSTQAAGRINSSAVASQYATATVENAALKPAVLAVSAFSGGDDDAASITDSSYVDALDLFNDALGSGAVICPESSSTDVVEGLVAHANTYSRVALLFGAEADTVSQIKADALAVQAEDHAEHAAYYYPWVEIPTGTAGITRFIPPVGYVAAKRAIAHNQSGPQLPAAGLLSSARFVLGLKSNITKTIGDDLDDNYVNAIRVIQNTIRIYGARSCSSDTDNFRYITQQDVVNSIVTECYRSIEDVVFSTIDGRNTIFASVESRLLSILTVMRNIGALYPAFDANGRQIDDGYTVRCDAGLNPVSQLATGLVKASVGVRVSSIGDRIEIEIVKSNLTSSVV
jgi:phage tail sheath protein FI